MGLRSALWRRATAWLNREIPREDLPPCDFERLSYEIRSGDVLLVEGRSRLAQVIKSVTLSSWTHAALYVGRLHEIDDPRVRERVREHYDADADEQLLIEAMLGHGTIVAPLAQYRDEHLRICRPTHLARRDAQAVIEYCCDRLGSDYDVRQLFDLARFLVPYGILPRRWRSSLFTRRPGQPTRTVCSTLLAEAFASVHYPVLPILRENAQGEVRLHKRNFKLFTPSDFDYSPYFDIIKYPLMSFDDFAVYRRLPWDAEALTAQDPLAAENREEGPDTDPDRAPSKRHAADADVASRGDC